MSDRAYIGIDNGVTGSIAYLLDGTVIFLPTPVFKEQSYTKKKQQITRVDHSELMRVLSPWKPARVFLERPFVNPHGFKATVSALRALEATLIIIETIGLSYQYIDSREWQKVMLPVGIKGTADLKKASLDIGCRLFPEQVEQIQKHKDADSLLIAEWARRLGL